MLLVVTQEEWDVMAASSPFQRISTNRLSDETVRQVRALIEQGIFKPGDKLPSERELIKELAVSRASIREALRILEGLGVIEVRPGLGAFVLDRSRTDLNTIWRSWLLEQRQEFIDLLEVREALETKAAALAAERISDEALQQLSAILRGMEDSARTENAEAAVEADIQFHELLSKASQNTFLIQLSDNISHAVLESRYGYFQQPNRIEASCRQHYRVLDALKRRDPEAASAAMLEHVRDSITAIKNLR